MVRRFLGNRQLSDGRALSGCPVELGVVGLCDGSWGTTDRPALAEIIGVSDGLGTVDPLGRPGDLPAAGL